jgi:plastocyanin
MKRSLSIGAFALLLSACGGASYGNNGLFKFSPAPTPSTSPTPSVPVATSTPVSVPSHAPSPVVKPFIISINGDNSGQTAFKPAQAQVYVGTPVEWVNHDTSARSATSDDGDPAGFDSGLLGAGKTYTFTPTRTGTYNYHDSTRPYAIAYFSVVNR